MIAKPKMLILTDSVSLPRKTDKGSVVWEDTYVYRLKNIYPQYEIIPVLIGAATIKDIRNQVNYYAILNPEIVIIQCGIVDCTPRAFGRIEMELIKKLRLFRLTKPFVKFLRKYRAHKYVSLKKFEQSLLALKTYLNPDIFFALSILPSCEDYEKKAPGITKSIEEYNSILKKHTTYVDLSKIPRNAILKDHHHINEQGHDFIFKSILEKKDECLKKV